MLKRLVRIIALWAVISPFAIARDCKRSCVKNIVCDIERSVEELTECTNRTITLEDLPFTINDPGVYEICSDLFWTPTDQGQVAITINSSDVTIKFNKHTLKQVDPTQFNCIGILINPDLSNIQVLNGTIENMSLFGLDAQSGDKNLLFDGINTFSCGYNGIKPIFVGSGGINIGDVNVLTDTPPNPIINVMLNNCNCNDNYCALDEGTFGVLGAGFFGVQQFVIQNCNFNGNSSNMSIDLAFNNQGVTSGLFIYFCQGARIENCNLNNNLGFGNATLAAFEADGCSDIYVANCQALDNISLVAYNAPSGIGFRNGCSNVLVENCIVQNFGAAGFETQVNGFSAEQGTSNIVFRNCTAQNIYDLPGQNLNPRGFLVADASQVVIENCVAQDIAGAGIFAGGFMAMSSDQVLFNNCQAQSIIMTPTYITDENFAACFCSKMDTNAFGVSGPISHNVIFQDCVGKNAMFNLNGSPFPTLARGFYAYGTQSLLVTNCTSLGNGIGLELDTFMGNPVTDATIANNVASNNSFAGFEDATTLDNTVTTSNLFYANRAYLNNDLNYFGVASSTPIRTWTFTAGNPPPTANNFGITTSESVDNLDIN